jgi:class 3 adenylate cyclase
MSRFWARQEPLDGPGMEHFPAAVLFADISGFTPLADRLAQRGPAGEELSGLLNAYFGQLTALIAAHAGEVITFAGDGLLAAWPAIDEDLAISTRRAGRAALAVGAALHDYQAGNGVRLSLRLGVGAGEVMALRVGGMDGCWQLLLSGAPLLQVSQAEQRAAPGQAVLSPQAGSCRDRPGTSATRCTPMCRRWSARGWALGRPSGWPSCGQLRPSSSTCWTPTWPRPTNWTHCSWSWPRSSRSSSALRAASSRWSSTTRASS